MDELYILLALLHRLSPPGTRKPLSEKRKPMTLEQACCQHFMDSKFPDVTLDDLADDRRRAQVMIEFYCR